MKKTSLLLYLAFSFCGSISFAQQALTPEVLQTLKESYSHDDAHKAIRNAVNANSIKKLTANSEQAATPDTWFSQQVKSSASATEKQRALLAVYGYQRDSCTSHGPQRV